MNRINWKWLFKGWFTRPEVGALESFFMRFLFALIVAYTLRMPVTQTIEPHPVGLLRLLHWMDDSRTWLTWLAHKDAAGVYANFEIYRNVIYVLLGAYAAGVVLPLVLPVLAVMHILPFTLFDSQGYPHHGNQIVSLLLLVQAGTVLWQCVRDRRWNLRPPDAVLRGWLLWQSVTLIAGTYFLSVITKLLQSNGLWLWNANNFALDMIKTQRQSWLNRLSPEFAEIPANALWMLEHPWTARIIFGSGLILETVCILAIGNRLLGLIMGVSFLFMHRAIDALMGGVAFPYNELLVLVFFVGVPFGIAWLLEKTLPRAAGWGLVAGAAVGVPLAWFLHGTYARFGQFSEFLQAAINCIGAWGSSRWLEMLEFAGPLLATCAVTGLIGAAVAAWLGRRGAGAVAVA